MFSAAMTLMLQCVAVLFHTTQELTHNNSTLKPQVNMNVAESTIGGHVMTFNSATKRKSVGDTWREWNEGAIGLLQNLQQLIQLSTGQPGTADSAGNLLTAENLE